MKAFVSRQRNGLYMLTYFKPTLCKIYMSEEYDFYVKDGDPLGVRNLCDIILLITGAAEINKLETIEVEFFGKVIDRTSPKESS